MVWVFPVEDSQVGDWETQRQSRTRTFLDHMAGLSIDSKGSFIRLSSIICTIGPSCNAVNMLEKMMETGMNIARLNFSHGSYEYHSETIQNIRTAIENVSKETGTPIPVAIALDTKGPEIRTGLLSGGISSEIDLVEGNTIRLTIESRFANSSTSSDLYIDYENLPKVITPGDIIFIDDGQFSLRVESASSTNITCRIEVGGKLGSRKGVNLPNIDVDLPAVSQKDKDDLEFGVEQGVDMIFASFIRDAKCVEQIRKYLGENGKNILIVSKIENHQGVNNLDEIIEVSDGIMVARGDLGIEIPTEKVFLAQKAIIAKCNKLGKPCICATQMLESMTLKPRPTRAEASDVANAILDGADCVMLSGETAKGNYPLECVKAMATISREAEAAVWTHQLYTDLINKQEPPVEINHSIAIVAVEAASKVLATAIITFTATGRIAHLLSKYRPRCPIVAITRCPQIARQAHLYRGIIPIFFSGYKALNTYEDEKTALEHVFSICIRRHIIRCGDKVVLVSKTCDAVNYTNALQIVSVPYTTGKKTTSNMSILS